MRSFIRSFVPFVSLVAVSAVAQAHVSISSGPAQANKSGQIITFSVGHGCEVGALHLDTVKIRVAIPAGVTSVRPLFGDFGTPALIKDGGGALTHVEWTKRAADVLANDDAYYEIKLRVKTPDVAFTKLQWNITQTCNNQAGTNPVVVEWNQPEGAAGNPGALLTIVPARTSGWNKVTMAKAVAQDDLGTYFGDAAIVWRGSSAYSSNANTAMMIANTPGVTPLTGGIAAGDEVWVKY
jgi:hypothetical protein